jgi:hypothetical protein
METTTKVKSPCISPGYRPLFQYFQDIESVASLRYEQSLVL